MKIKNVSLLALLFISPAQALDASPAGQWSFESDQPGRIAAGFSNQYGDWKVQSYDKASDGKQVLAQLAGSYRFNVALVDDSRYRDVDVSVKMQSVSGSIDQGGGLVWRAVDKNNYYIARFNPLEDNYRVYKVVDGSRSQLDSARIKKTPGWHQLRVTMQGDHIQCYYDGKLYLDVKDDTFKQAGMIGLWTKADARSYFDELSVR